MGKEGIKTGKLLGIDVDFSIPENFINLIEICVKCKTKGLYFYSVEINSKEYIEKYLYKFNAMLEIKSKDTKKYIDEIKKEIIKFNKWLFKSI